MNIPVPKGHKLVTADLSNWEMEGPLDDVVATLKEAAKGITSPTLVPNNWGYGFTVQGTRPQTPAEKAAEAKRAEKRKLTAQRKAERKLQDKKDLLARLKAELGE